jgi:hypothetical protein
MAWTSLLFSGLNSLLAVTASSDSLVRQLPSCYILSSTCVERNGLRCADELPRRRSPAAGKKLRTSPVVLQQIIGGAQASQRRRSGARRSSVMPPIAGPATAVPTKGLGGAECQDLHFCHLGCGCGSWWSLVCLLRSSAVLQNHEVASGWHVRWRHRRRDGSVALAPDAVPDMLQGQERGEGSPSARHLHL